MRRSFFRILSRIALAAFIVSWVSTGIHTLLHSGEDEGIECGPGAKVECGGCDLPDHHHHTPVRPESMACRTCAAATLILPVYFTSLELTQRSSIAEFADRSAVIDAPLSLPAQARAPPTL